MISPKVKSGGSRAHDEFRHTALHNIFDHIRGTREPATIDQSVEATVEAQ